MREICTAGSMSRGGNGHPSGKPFREAWRSLGSPKPATAALGRSPEVHYGDNGCSSNEMGIGPNGAAGNC